jgi:Leucine-rich repeat (LRR) protein
MRILGWILTVLGGILCFGALIELANGQLYLDGITLLTIGLCVTILVIGIIILNSNKSIDWHEARTSIRPKEEDSERRHEVEPEEYSRNISNPQVSDTTQSYSISNANEVFKADIEGIFAEAIKSTAKALKVSDFKATGLDKQETGRIIDDVADMLLLSVASIKPRDSRGVRVLDCSKQRLAELNVSESTALEELRCGGNQLTELNVSGLRTLRGLYCSANQLTELNFSGCTALKELYCKSNQLTKLNVSGYTALETLECWSNELIELNVNGCTALQWLSCNDNRLTKLNVSKLTALKWLSCGDNQLTELNVSGLRTLRVLECYNNQLTELNFSELTALEKLNCTNNQLTAASLNTLFGTLHSNTISTGKSIRIGGNPGARTCDMSIAKNKGWRVLIECS